MSAILLVIDLKKLQSNNHKVDYGEFQPSYFFILNLIIHWLILSFIFFQFQETSVAFKSQFKWRETEERPGPGETLSLAVGSY